MPDLCAAVHPEQPVVKCTLLKHAGHEHWNAHFGVGWVGPHRSDPRTPSTRPADARRWVMTEQPIECYSGRDPDDVVHEGVVIGYQAAPTVLVRKPSGEIVPWAIGITRAKQEPAPTGPPSCDCQQGAPSDVDGELRDKIAAAIAEADGRYLGLEPLADATYPEMADAALSVVRPLLDAKDRRIAGLERTVDAARLNRDDVRRQRDAARERASDIADQLASSNEHNDELEAEVERVTKGRASLSTFRTRAAHAALCLDEQEDDEILAEIDKLRDDLAAARNAIEQLNQVERERDLERERYAELRKRAVILPDDWRQDLWNAIENHDSFTAIKRAVELVKTWSAPTPVGPSQPRTWLPGDPEPHPRPRMVRDKGDRRWHYSTVTSDWIARDVASPAHSWDDLLSFGPLTEVLAPSIQDGE